MGVGVVTVPTETDSAPDRSGPAETHDDAPFPGPGNDDAPFPGPGPRSRVTGHACGEATAAQLAGERVALADPRWSKLYRARSRLYRRLR